MNWNFNFTLSAMTVLGILLWFYTHAKVLPLKKNLIFKRILELSFLACTLNLLSVYMDSFEGNSYDIGVIVLSYLYYGLFVYIFYLLFIYGMTHLDMDAKLRAHTLLYKLPLYAFLSWSLITTYTGNFFYIDKHGRFSFGKFFSCFYMALAIYTFLMIYNEYKKRQKFLSFEKAPITAVLSILLIGIICDGLSKSIILTDIFLCISELILYIALENPNFYVSNATYTYNAGGFIKLTDELLVKKKQFYVAGCRISNLPSLQKHHGTRNLFRTLRITGLWFKYTFPDAYIFYPDNQCFVFVSTSPIDIAHVQNTCRKRFISPFEYRGIKVFLRGTVFVFDDPNTFQSGSDLLSAMQMRQNFVDDKQIRHINDTERCDVEKRSVIEKLLHQHIATNDISVYYQPLVSCHDNSVTGAEALVRIMDSELGLIMPDTFIPVAEQSGAIVELGYTIFEHVCRFASSQNFRDSGLKFLSVNLSTVQLQNPTLAYDLKSIADRYGMDFSFFDFEITETGLTSEKVIADQIQILKSLGAGVSLDDFGTGNANLARLIKFPFSVAKLDMSLVWGYFRGENCILENIIDMFRNENLKIVAEGVETKEMATALAALHVDYLQGYYYAKPLSEEDFITFIKTFGKS